MRALARDASRLEPRAGVEVATGDLLSGRGLARGARRLHRPPTTSCTRWRRSPGTRPRAASPTATAAPPRTSPRPRRAAGVERVVYLGGIAPADGAPSPHLASRLEVERDPARGGSRGDRAARVDRDRRRLVVLPDAGAARRAPARPAVARLAPQPHPADRRARRDRVPRPHAAGRGRRRALARHRRTGRAQLRRDDRADRRVDGRRPAADRPRLLADPAGQRGGERRDRPAARAGAPADGEPRARPAAARRPRGARALRHPRRSRSTARWSTRWPSGSAPRSWPRDEGRARGRRSTPRPRTCTTW